MKKICIFISIIIITFIVLIIVSNVSYAITFDDLTKIENSNNYYTGNIPIKYGFDISYSSNGVLISNSSYSPNQLLDSATNLYKSINTSFQSDNGKINIYFKLPENIFLLKDSNDIIIDSNLYYITNSSVEELTYDSNANTYINSNNVETAPNYYCASIDLISQTNNSYRFLQVNLEQKLSAIKKDSTQEVVNLNVYSSYFTGNYLSIEGDKSFFDGAAYMHGGVNSRATLHFVNSLIGKRVETPENFTFKSNDESIIKINEKNELELIKEGTTSIQISNSLGIVNSVYFEVLSEADWEDYYIQIYGDVLKSNDTDNLKDLIGALKIANLDITNDTNKVINNTVFEKLETTNSTLNITEGSVIWSFESQNITNTNINFSPSLNISTEILSKIESQEIKDAIFIDFMHSGALPGKATVSINVSTLKYGDGEKTLYLYYYNPETKSYEYLSDVKYIDGIVTFQLDHCSEYALTDAKIIESNDNLDNPPTGDIKFIIINFIGIIGILGIIYCVKKERN